MSDSVVIKLLIVFAVLRVGFLSAAYPFFNNVDERFHVDLVVKYAHGILPNPEHSKIEPESARLFVNYGTPEYIQPPQPRLLPFWKQLEDRPGVAGEINQRAKKWERAENYESLSPPFYYALCAGWYNLGKMLNIKEKFLLYWVKALNMVVYFGIMATAYLLAKRLMPHDRRFQVASLILLAAFPQDIFYAINCDVLSAFMVPLAWLMLLRVADGGMPRWFLWFTGLAVSMAVLTKLTNLPFLVFAFLCIGWIILQWRRNNMSAGGWRRIGELIAFCLLPIILWCTYNYLVVGDLLATHRKVEFLGWHVKELSQMIEHPIFTYEGLRLFFQTTVVSFWRGEFTWHLQHIGSPAMSLFYVYSTIILFAASLAAPLLFWENGAKKIWCTLLPSLVLILGYFAYLFLITIAYDWGTCWYPSQSSPYLTSGRLLIGALVPFVFVCILGLQSILKVVRLDRFLLHITAVVACVLVVNKIWLSLPAIKSKFNMFAMFYL